MQSEAKQPGGAVDTDILRHGGCLCGAVRYSVPWPPLLIATCQCDNCQKQAGSALSIIAFFPRDQVQISGVLTRYHDKGQSGGEVERQFCGTCGSPVVTDTPGALAQNMRFIKAGTLDRRSDLVPTRHYWTQSAQAWLVLPPGDCLETQ